MHSLTDLRRRLSIEKNAPGHLSLLQQELNGGKITRAQIDTIADHPEATTLAISGLEQATLEHFVERFGNQFDGIMFWKCPRVADLTPLEHLTRPQFMEVFWNQKTTRLWNLGKSTGLRGLRITDFGKLNALDDLATGTALEELEIGNAVWSKASFQTLEPMGALRELKSLWFSALKIGDGRIEPLARLAQLSSLDFPAKLFTQVQLAWLRAHLPASVSGSALSATRRLANPLTSRGKPLDTLVLGAGKPFLHSVNDATKLRKFEEAFAAMVEFFHANPEAAPEHYSG
jgi:hypothetical protein